MDELITIMGEIRDQLVELNNKIDNLTGGGSNDISDIVGAVEGIKGNNGYDLTDIYSALSNSISVSDIQGYANNNFTDVCNKLDQIDSSLSTIDFTIQMKD